VVISQTDSTTLPKRVLIIDMAGVWLRGSLFSFLKRGYALLGKKYSYIPPNAEILPREFFLGTLDARSAFASCFGQTLSDTEFESLTEFWKNNWKLDTCVWQYLMQLRDCGYTLACLTNSDPLNFSVYQEKGYFIPFHTVIASHKVGLLKPDKAIFDLAIQSVGAQYSECVYVDDQERLVVVARELGLESFVFTDFTSFVSTLTTFGISCDEVEHIG
jgi:hypothetical protein